jgi:hypothetical protein
MKVLTSINNVVFKMKINNIYNLKYNNKEIFIAIKFN